MAETLSLRGKNILFLLADGFDSKPYHALRQCLEVQGANILIASFNHGDTLISGNHEERVVSQVSFALAVEVAYDAIIIPDAVTARFVNAQPPVRRLLELTKARRDAVVVAFDGGISALLHAGIVGNATLATPSELVNAAMSAGARIADAPIAISGNLLTARADADVTALCHELAQFLRQGWAEAA